MSKLIEADGVKNSLLTELLSGVDGCTDASYLKTYEVIDRIEKIVNEWVDNQPTVEAIPVEWIESQLNVFGDGFYNLRLVIKQWEKENERMDNR